SYIDASETAVEMIRQDKKMLRLRVLEKDISYLKEGQKVLFQPRGHKDKTWESRIINIEKILNENGLLNVYCTLPKEGNEHFISGMFTSASIVLDTFQSLALPLEAVVEVDGKSFVLVSNQEKSLEFNLKETSTGVTNDGMIEIPDADQFSMEDEFIVTGAYYLIK
ncbi:MAG: efflux RND transporter periplasmic adaptor subunit, partial [Saprospiraceae bacterium]|nr:efflux RND transporter periplasmic adaptor subunit [Saprospiraceae bacterium]